MGIRMKRKLIRVGSMSKAIILPKAWLDYHGEDIDIVTLIGDGILLVVPLGYERKAKRMLELVEGSKR